MMQLAIITKEAWLMKSIFSLLLALVMFVSCVAIAEDNTLTWEEDQEHIADGMVFEFLPAAE